MDSVIAHIQSTLVLAHWHFEVSRLTIQSLTRVNRFNWAARKLQKRLLQLGACEIYPRGEADEQHPEGYNVFFNYFF